MKPLRIILGLALVAGLFLALKFLWPASMAEGGSPETAAAAEESHPDRPSPAIADARDLLRTASSSAASDSSRAAAGAPVAPRRRDEDLAGPDQPAPEETSDPRAAHGTLVLIDEAEIPAEEAGKLMQLQTALKGPDGKTLLKDGSVQWDKEIKEGMEVNQGELLGQIDDSQARMAKEVAECEYRAAKKEAENKVSVKHAEKLVELYDAQFHSANEANRKAPQAISYYDMLQLQFKCQEGRMQVEQAQHELDVAALKAAAAMAKSESAGQDIQRRQIKSPLSGMIVKRYRHEGEWVKPGDSVLRIVRLDRLRVRAVLDANRILPADVDGKDATVAFRNGGPRTFRGKIEFASPIIEIDRKFLVHAEVVNEKDRSGHWILLPGLPGCELKIEK
jgi:macrolide-specific efflux system membrane fusion protein